MRPGVKIGDEAVLDSIVEQLKNPLLTIQLLVESGDTAKITEITKSSLRLIDDLQYLRELSKNRQQSLELAPVNIKLLSEEVAAALSPLASTRNINLETNIKTDKPVLSDYGTLRRAYENMALGSLLMIDSSDNRMTLSLCGTNRSGATVFGAYSEAIDLTAKDLNRLRRLFGQSRRPLGMHSLSSGLELFVSDGLLRLLGGRMRTSINNHRRGFAVDLIASNQLALVT